MATKAEQEQQLYIDRSLLLKRLMEHYEADGPDGSVPHAARRTDTYHPRYVLTEQYDDKGNYFLNLADSLEGIQMLAAESVTSGSAPRCYHDLDVLAGEAPSPMVDDRVRYQGKEYYVVQDADDVEYGEKFTKLWLDPNPDTAFDDAEHCEIDEKDVEIIERAEPDERLPVRYDVARVEVFVAFNTTPTED